MDCIVYTLFLNICKKLSPLNKKIISIELNEINLEWLKFYIKKNKLRNFKTLFSKYKQITTISENKYENLEPWIQWPSFYSGMPLEKHNCFHLGEGKSLSGKTIYDHFQNNGKSVLAVSPMNCIFDIKNQSKLFPDPWTEYSFKDSNFENLLWGSVKSIVNTNAAGSASVKDYFIFLLGFLKYASFKNYLKYLRLIFLSVKYKWAKAILLDRFLVDFFLNLYKKNNYKYSSLFLNAGAHIQHHHLYDSLCYQGKNTNPRDYSPAAYTDIDPIFEILNVYDDLIGIIMKRFQNETVLITTGLQQTDNKKPYFQYRANNHFDFYKSLNFKFTNIEPRMSRDVSFQGCSLEDIEHNKKLCDKYTIDGKPLFKAFIEKTTGDLFIKINWTGIVEGFKQVKFEGQYLNIADKVSLVSIENAIHQSYGWHVNINSGIDFDSNEKIYIWDFFKKLVS